MPTNELLAETQVLQHRIADLETQVKTLTEERDRLRDEIEHRAKEGRELQDSSSALVSGMVSIGRGFTSTLAAKDAALREIMKLLGPLRSASGVEAYNIARAALEEK